MAAKINKRSHKVINKALTASFFSIFAGLLSLSAFAENESTILKDSKGYSEKRLEAKQEENAKSLLNRMIKSIHEKDYRGKLLFQTPTNTKTAEIVHKHNCNDAEYEYIKSLDGPDIEFVKINGDIVKSQNTQKSPVFERFQRKPFFHAFSKGAFFDQVSDVYRFSVDGTDRVANRATTLVSISPADNIRYGYNFWIDNETGMALKMCLTNENNPVEQFMFVDIEIPAEISDSEIKLSSDEIEKIKSTPKQTTVMEDQGSDKSIWQIESLPYGFNLLGYEKRGEPDSNPLMEHFIFSDGIATISVYIEPKPENSSYAGRYRFGVLNGYSIIIDNFQVMVLGEVPASTAESVAKAISKK